MKLFTAQYRITYSWRDKVDRGLTEKTKGETQAATWQAEVAGSKEAVHATCQGKQMWVRNQAGKQKRYKGKITEGPN